MDGFRICLSSLSQSHICYHTGYESLHVYLLMFILNVSIHVVLSALLFLVSLLAAVLNDG